MRERGRRWKNGFFVEISSIWWRVGRVSRDTEQLRKKNGKKRGSEGYLATGRSKRKRHKSHSDHCRAIDRGDEARSAICKRDRPLQRISRADVDRGIRAYKYALRV